MPSENFSLISSLPRLVSAMSPAQQRSDPQDENYLYQIYKVQISERHHQPVISSAKWLENDLIFFVFLPSCSFVLNRL